MKWNDEVSHFAATDVGLKRSHNQDAFGVSLAHSQETWEKRGHLFVVADGMGAHAVGELASKLAVDTIRQNYIKTRQQALEVALGEAITDANQTIHERGNQNREFKGMGTTATTLVLCPTGAFIGHVGDSRCYRIRGARIDQLSFDHSLQWELAKRQKVPPEELTSVPSNIIIRSLGPQPKVKVDVDGPYPVQEGDRFLLCSDGLSGPVKDPELWAIINYLPGEEACRFLVHMANLRGGLDNITAMLVLVGNPEHAHADSSHEEIKTARFGRRAFWGVISSALTYGILAALCAVPMLAGIASEVFAGLSGVFAIMALLIFGLKIWSKRHAPSENPVGPPPIHRTHICGIDRGIVEQMLEEDKRLREVAAEENWEVDWKLLKQRHQQADELLANGSFPDAFREVCRSITILSEGMRKHLGKQEKLKPNWEQDNKS